MVISAHHGISYPSASTNLAVSGALPLVVDAIATSTGDVLYLVQAEALVSRRGHARRVMPLTEIEESPSRYPAATVRRKQIGRNADSHQPSAEITATKSATNNLIVLLVNPSSQSAAFACHGYLIEGSRNSPQCVSQTNSKRSLSRLHTTTNTLSRYFETALTIRQTRAHHQLIRSGRTGPRRSSCCGGSALLLRQTSTRS